MPITNFTKIPLVNPVKFVPNTANPAWGFDNNWYYNQIKEWELKRTYYQKWMFGLTTPLQVWSTVAPADAEIYNCAKELVLTIPWTQVGTSDVGNIYELILNLDEDGNSDPMPVGVYYIYTRFHLLGYDYSIISEPIHLAVSHPCTNTITYTHSENTQDFFPSLLSTPFKILLEADMINFQPGREVSDYVNQLHNVTLLDGVPFREFQLAVGRAPGVADYVVDILNRITCCDMWSFNGMLFSIPGGSKWEPTRIKTWPMSGWVIDVSPAVNATSLEYNQGGPVAPGLVTAYDINNDLFGGTGTNVPITDYTQS